MKGAKNIKLILAEKQESFHEHQHLTKQHQMKLHLKVTASGARKVQQTNGREHRLQQQKPPASYMLQHRRKQSIVTRTGSSG